MSRTACWLFLGLAFCGTGLPGAPPAAPSPDAAPYAAYYLPDAVEYAGTIFAYLKNTTKEPLAVREITLDGKSIGKVWSSDRTFLEAGVREQYLNVADERLAWYRVYPNPVPPGGIGEIMLRLTPTAARTQQYDLRIAFAGHDPLRVVVPLGAPAFTLEYVGISKDLDEVHIYLRRQPGSDPGPWRVEIDGEPAGSAIQPAPADYELIPKATPQVPLSGHQPKVGRERVGVRGIAGRHVTGQPPSPPAPLPQAGEGSFRDRLYVYAHVKLAQRWQPGSFHAVAVGTPQQRRAVLLRALPTPPPLAIMGNLSEREAEQYATHLFDAHIAFTPGKAEAYDKLEKFGLGGAYQYSRKLKTDDPRYEPVRYDQPEVLEPIKGRRSFWAYFLEDEPDGRYHHTRLSLAAISRDVERANQFCRVFDPQHPTYLQIDHGGYPRNLYLYSQIPDYVCTHAYAMGTPGVVEATQDHVRHTQAASRPRPFYYLNCGYCRRKEGRQFEPDEIRLEAYTALAMGAKSLQWYPAHGDSGLLAHPAMWNAVGEINGVLHQVLPLASLGMPVDQPVVDNEKVLSSCILCGDKAMVVVLVNKDFEVTPEKFVLRPMEKVNVTVRLPAFLKAIGVAAVGFPSAVIDKPAEIDRSQARFSTRLQAGAALVIYTDQSQFEQLRQAHAACLDRYRPLPEKPH